MWVGCVDDAGVLVDLRVPSCVLYVAVCVGEKGVCVCVRVHVCVRVCVCAADIDIPAAAEAEAHVFKVSALSSQPGIPKVQKREGVSEEREQREKRE